MMTLTTLMTLMTPTMPTLHTSGFHVPSALVNITYIPRVTDLTLCNLGD
jgi:hypothetical protein